MRSAPRWRDRGGEPFLLRGDRRGVAAASARGSRRLKFHPSLCRELLTMSGGRACMHPPTASAARAWPARIRPRELPQRLAALRADVSYRLAPAPISGSASVRNAETRRCCCPFRSGCASPQREPRELMICLPRSEPERRASARRTFDWTSGHAARRDARSTPRSSAARASTFCASSAARRSARAWAATRDRFQISPDPSSPSPSSSRRIQPAIRAGTHAYRRMPAAVGVALQREPCPLVPQPEA